MSVLRLVATAARDLLPGVVTDKILVLFVDFSPYDVPLLVAGIVGQFEFLSDGLMTKHTTICGHIVVRRHP